MYVSGKQGKGHNLTFSIGSGTAVLYMFSQLTGRLCSDQKSSQKTKIGATAVNVRERVNGKKTFSFGHCPNYGGGEGLPMPEFFGPLFRSAFLVNKKSLFLQKCQCIELLTVF